MSAVSAIYDLTGRAVEPTELRAVLDCLKHRGDDASGVWTGGAVGLGHRMHWTTPESLNEKLPLERGPFVLTCDARIDNRDELIPRLAFGERRAAEIADSEIVLAAYEKWGEDCPSKLIGDFVFALWDAREKKLFAARDPLGIKQFYYYYKPGRYFALASEIKALLELDIVPRELNEESLADYLTINTEDKELTLYKDILRLPATHALRIDANGLAIREYWRPVAKEIRLKNAGEYHEAFREKLSEAVECRLRSAFPIGSTLSGGLDSSAVVCLASRHLKAQGRAPLHTFSGIFPTVSKLDPRIDELRYMRSVIEKSGCEAHFINADDASPLRNADKIIWHADHPAGYINMYMASEIYEAARRENVRVLLGGHDGDCTVSYGYEDFEQLARRGRFVRMVREAIALGRNMPSAGHKFGNLVWKRGIRPAIPENVVRAWRTLRGRGVDEKTNNPGFFPLHVDSVNQSFRDKAELRERIQRYQKAAYPDGITGTERHWRVLTNGLAMILHELNDNLSAGFGIEQRHPFYDRRLIEFCINLPPGQRLYRGWTRSIFRFAMQDILPPEVQWRTGKANLGAHVKINLFKYESATLENLARRNVRKLERFINIDKLQSAVRSCSADPNKKDAEVMLVVTSAYLLSWLEQSGFAEN